MNTHMYDKQANFHVQGSILCCRSTSCMGCLFLAMFD
jgi:hypothetical protein